MFSRPVKRRASPSSSSSSSSPPSYQHKAKIVEKNALYIGFTSTSDQVELFVNKTNNKVSENSRKVIFPLAAGCSKNVISDQMFAEMIEIIPPHCCDENSRINFISELCSRSDFVRELADKTPQQLMHLIDEDSRQNFVDYCNIISDMMKVVDSGRRGKSKADSVFKSALKKVRKQDDGFDKKFKNEMRSVHRRVELKKKLISLLSDFVLEDKKDNDDDDKSDDSSSSSSSSN